MSARCVTSQLQRDGGSPIAFATLLAPSPLMSATTTFAPSARVHARDLRAEAARGAGDDRDLVLEPAIAPSSDVIQPWYWTRSSSSLISSSATKPFSRPWPLRLTPPNGSSTPPPAP